MRLKFYFNLRFHVNVVIILNIVVSDMSSVVSWFLNNMYKIERRTVVLNPVICPKLRVAMFISSF